MILPKSMNQETEYRELEETLTKALHERSIEILELEETNRAYKARIKDLTKENDDFDTQVKNLANIISDRVHRVDQLTAEKDALRSEVKELQEALESRERELISRNF